MKRVLKKVFVDRIDRNITHPEKNFQVAFKDIERPTTYILCNKLIDYSTFNKINWNKEYIIELEFGDDCRINKVVGIYEKI